MINAAFQTFGKESFQNGIFYRVPRGLRFELSCSGSRVDMFMRAYHRATTILNSVFKDCPTISIGFAFPGDSYLSDFSTFKQLRRLAIEIPQQRDTLSEWVEDDE